VPWVVDEFTREALAVRVARRPGAADAVEVPSDPFVLRGVPARIRPDNGPEFVAKRVRGWVGGVGARTAHTEKGTLRWPSTGCASGTLASSAHGKTDVWKASTAGCATSRSTPRRSTRSPGPGC
jgi:hypothetical protein